MRYEREYGHLGRGPRRARQREQERLTPEHPDIHITRRRAARPPAAHPPERGYTGPGEAGRYGHAPVPYGPEHTYDYHLGDRYGRGPDYRAGEERVRRGRREWRRTSRRTGR